MHWWFHNSNIHETGTKRNYLRSTANLKDRPHMGLFVNQALCRSVNCLFDWCGQIDNERHVRKWDNPWYTMQCMSLAFSANIVHRHSTISLSLNVTSPMSSSMHLYIYSFIYLKFTYRHVTQYIQCING